MAIVAYLVEKELTSGENDLRDNVSSMIVAIDDTVDLTPSAIRARAVTVANANGVALPDGYFTDQRNIVTSFATADDVFITNGEKIVDVVA